MAVVTLDISMIEHRPADHRAHRYQRGRHDLIVNVYYLAVIAALLPLAALGEIHGHRRIFFAGLLVFALGSLACGLAGAAAGPGGGTGCRGWARRPHRQRRRR